MAAIDPKIFIAKFTKFTFDRKNFQNDRRDERTVKNQCIQVEQPRQP